MTEVYGSPLSISYLPSEMRTGKKQARRAPLPPPGHTHYPSDSEDKACSGVFRDS